MLILISISVYWKIEAFDRVITAKFICMFLMIDFWILGRATAGGL